MVRILKRPIHEEDDEKCCAVFQIGTCFMVEVSESVDSVSTVELTLDELKEFSKLVNEVVEEFERGET